MMFSSIALFKRHIIVLIVCLVLLNGVGQFGVARATASSGDVVVCVDTKSGVMRQAAKATCGKTERIVRLSSAASSTPTSGQVVVCVDKKSGVMRQTGKATCGKTERIVRLSTGATSTSTSGSQSATGPAGATGLSGATGPTGARGLSGATGPAGSAGDDGKKGNTGVAGPAGSAGDSGKKGNTGAIGPAGPAGEAGSPGLQGDPGFQGIIGPTGPGTQWVYDGSGSFGGLGSTPIALYPPPVGIECWRTLGGARYRLKIAASVSESVLATVSKVGVEGSSITHVIETSAFSQVGGDRSTNDIWHIRVLGLNYEDANVLKKQYIVKVQLGTDSCFAEMWETS